LIALRGVFVGSGCDVLSSKINGRIFKITAGTRMVLTAYKGHDLTQEWIQTLPNAGIWPALMHNDADGGCRVQYGNKSGVIVQAEGVDDYRDLGIEMALWTTPGLIEPGKPWADPGNGITYYFANLPSESGTTENVYCQRRSATNTQIPWSDGVTLEKAVLVNVLPAGPVACTRSGYTGYQPLILVHGSDMYYSLDDGETWTPTPA